ncbi:MAG: glycosyltransferase family 39 protein, partial [Anaerolineales bacterium]|nr:glycosyltransferase family 39 protein [Anaerolineales bacterium]
MLTTLILLAAVLRLYGLNNVSPPGITHDEVANWLIDRSILAGNHAIYFTRAYGHEAGFHYIQAAFVALLGDNVLALRLPTAFAGLLGVAVSYALVRKLFGRDVALFSAVLLAVLFWPVFYSRLGLRAILLPLFSGLSAYFFVEGMNLTQRHEGTKTQRR